MKTNKILPFLKKPQKVVHKDQEQIFKDNRAKRETTLKQFDQRRNNKINE
ncbi:hypothetical protein SAMN05428987_5030 [Paenibacillus sp. CF095]|nr:hypothetical protein [Paenibacillus sp. CF095]SDD50484.1 hypothetical protein SAMN05428987_5030 [Paenibacillus sp. CF095]